MSTVVKSYIKLLIMYFKANLSAAMEYRTSFIINTAGMMINNLLYTFFWFALFGKMNLIGGYSLKDMMFIWALGNAAFGLSAIIFGNGWRLSNSIIDGSLDTYIVQPKNVLLNVLMSRSLIGSWGDFLFGWILYFMFFGLNIKSLIIFTVCVIAGACVISAFEVVVNTLTFYWGNAQPVANLSIESLITFLTYPDGIFQGWVRVLLFTLLPAGFIVYKPMNLIRGFNAETIGILIIFDVLYVLFAFWFFNRGLKRYESGNLITTKL